MTAAAASSMVWRPALPVGVTAVLVVLLAAWAVWVWRRLRARFSRRRSTLLALPRFAAVVLLVLALFDPRVLKSVPAGGPDRVIALVDVSSSMDTADVGGRPRAAAAADALKRLRAALPRSARLDALYFDTALHAAPPESGPVPGPAAVRGTDLGAALLATAARVDRGTDAAVVVLSDGGDEPVAVRPPAVPVLAVGVGSDLAGVTDVAVRPVGAPESVEVDADFEVVVDVRCHTAGARVAAGALAAHRVTLQRRTDGGDWTDVETQAADLRAGQARVTFKQRASSEGVEEYRVEAGALAGEVSTLNNAATYRVVCRRRAVHVLYFAREVGADLKVLRQELSRDPGVTFTALFRTVGERFTVLGERRPGDEDLGAGFPGDAGVLDLFDVIVISGVPAADWTEPQVAALMDYVERGGAVAFLGGDASFGAGGYGESRLALLLPWSLPAESDALRGRFPVYVPAAASAHPALNGVESLLTEAGAEAGVESVNPAGALKPGAVELFQTVVAGRRAPLAALQPYGKGRVFALASNTQWRWVGRGEALSEAYGRFWRQLVRELAGAAEDDARLLRVRWDRPFYRPGETASAEIDVAGRDAARGLDLAASVTHAGGQVAAAVAPREGQAGGWRLDVVFPSRGDYTVKVRALRGGQTVETYERELRVAPSVGEGTRLELNRGGLEDMAATSGGVYTDAANLDPVLNALRARLAASSVTVEVSPASDAPWFALAWIALLVMEWSVRRWMNLI